MPKGYVTAFYAKEVKDLLAAAEELEWHADTNAKANKAKSARAIRLAGAIRRVLEERGYYDPFDNGGSGL